MILSIILFSLSIFSIQTYALFDDGKQVQEISKKEEMMNKIENVYYKYRSVIHFFSGLLSCINFILFCIEILKKYVFTHIHHGCSMFKEWIIKELQYLYSAAMQQSTFILFFGILSSLNFII